MPPDEDESIYKQRLELAKQIFEYNFAIDKGMKKIPEEFITDINEKIKSAEKKLKWNPITWAEDFGYSIPDQSANSAADEKTNGHTAMPSEALNTTSPRQTNLTQARDEMGGAESKFNPR